MKIQLSLALGVLGHKKTDALIETYTKLMEMGKSHEDIEDEMIDAIQNLYDEDIEEYCNKYMILSNMKVAEDIVRELKQLNN